MNPKQYELAKIRIDTLRIFRSVWLHKILHVKRALKGNTFLVTRSFLH